METQQKATNTVWFKALLVVAGAAAGALGYAAVQRWRNGKEPCAAEPQEPKSQQN